MYSIILEYFQYKKINRGFYCLIIILLFSISLNDSDRILHLKSNRLNLKNLLLPFQIISEIN